MPIRAVLFDLDGTLCYTEPPGREIFCDYAESLGLSLRVNARRHVALWEHLYWAQSPELLADRAELGHEKTFWVRYCARQLQALGLSAEQALALAPQFGAYMDENYHSVDLIFADAPETLSSLRAEGYTLGVVSNRHRPFDDYLTEKGLLHLVDFTLSASVAQSWKPNPGIFLHALQMAGAAPAETIYVGDNYHADVLGARAAGLHPILFDPAGLFENPACPVISELKQLMPLLGHEPHTMNDTP